LSASSLTRSAITRGRGRLIMLACAGVFLAGAAHEVRATAVREAAELFGMHTEPVQVGELRERWRQVVASMQQDFKSLLACRSDGPCPIAAQRLIEISNEGAGRIGRARLGLINRATNLAISPVSDQRQWSVLDHWSDPFETLLSYRGDCEDYAIVKYAALLEAGVAADDVKIVILKSVFPNEYHAVAAARVNGEWFILDNRTQTLVRDRDITRAAPLLVLDHEGVRRFSGSPRTGEGLADSTRIPDSYQPMPQLASP
jgi:predicted transglutaminase-like cysteine proteinase